MAKNEMVGPLGAATVFGPKAPPLCLVRMNLAILKTRLGQLVASLADRLKSKSSTPASWGGMQMFLGNQVPPDSAKKATVYRSFEKNLRDILRAGRKSGAHILLNTVVVNLKDCPPFASVSNSAPIQASGVSFDKLLADGAALETQGRFADAAQRYEQAAGAQPLSADAQYRWGECLLQLSNSPA